MKRFPRSAAGGHPSHGVVSGVGVGSLLFGWGSIQLRVSSENGMMQRRTSTISSSSSCSSSLSSIWLFCPRESRRAFHSGLDAARVQRLRRSGMTFNKPRGRDLLSIAFESRIRVLPLTDSSDLYAPPHPLQAPPPKKAQTTESQEEGVTATPEQQPSRPSCNGSSTPSPSSHSRSQTTTTVRIDVPEPNPLDPTSSAGNPIRLRRSAEGDERSQTVIQARAAQERAVAFKRAWHIAVVDPLPSRGFRLSCTAATPMISSSSSSSATTATLNADTHSATPTTTTTTNNNNNSHQHRHTGTALTRMADTTNPPSWSTSSTVLPQALLSPEAHTTLAAAAAVMWTSPVRAPIQFSSSLDDTIHHSSSSATTTTTTTTATTPAGLSSAVESANADGSSDGGGEANANAVAAQPFPPQRLHVRFTPPPVFFPQPHPQYYLSVEEGGIWPSSSSSSSHVDSASRADSSKRRARSLLERVTFQLPSVSPPPPSCSSAATMSPASDEKNPQTKESRNADNGRMPISVFLLPPAQRRHLQKSGDATRLPGCYTRTSLAAMGKGTTSPPVKEDTQHASSSTSSSSSSSSSTTIQQHYYLIPCLDPWLEKREYGREEAQVEMMTAYRNILFECAEMFQSLTAAQRVNSSSSSSAGAGAGGGPPVVDILRVPALCMGQWRRAGGEEEDDDEDEDGARHLSEEVPMWLHEIGKLNQQALIKGFHRLPQECKEALLQNPAFTVEVYVPPVWLDHFVKTFLEEAWETPSSTLRPARTALYPGLAPPPSLLAMEGWVGKRKELTDAVATRGKNLLRGPHYQLDGKPIVEQEVWTQIRVFGGREEEKERIEREKATATTTTSASHDDGHHH